MITENTVACEACGHDHRPHLGYICIGCPCPELPGKPAPEHVEAVWFMNSDPDANCSRCGEFCGQQSRTWRYIIDDAAYVCPTCSTTEERAEAWAKGHPADIAVAVYEHYRAAISAGHDQADHAFRCSLQELYDLLTAAGHLSQ